MNKLKRILFTLFIFAYLLAQFASVKAESVKAEYTDAANTEVITEVLSADKKPIDMNNALVTEPIACDEGYGTAREDFVPESIIKEKALDEIAPI